MYGIYQIVNNFNCKKYIGSSFDLNARKNTHFRKLKKGEHSNDHFQNAWNKYGEEAFQFEVLEEVEEDQLLKREQEYLDSYCLTGDWDKLYNISRGACSVMKGREHTDKAKKKMSNSRTGESHPLYGKNHSEDSKIKMSNTRCNLSKNEIVEMRGRYFLERDLTEKDLADEYGIGRRNVGHILDGNYMSHIIFTPIRHLHYEPKLKEYVENAGRYFLEDHLRQKDLSNGYDILRPYISTIINQDLKKNKK